MAAEVRRVRDFWNALASNAPERWASSGPGVSRATHPHAGLDLPGRRGEPVHAIGPGRVLLVGIDSESGHRELSGSRVYRASTFQSRLKAPYGAGLYVVVDHGKGLHSFYAHLDSVTVQPGQGLRGGQTIGGMGDSGTNPVGGVTHLHLEVFHTFTPRERSTRYCLDPRGWQRWTSRRDAWTSGGTKVWPIEGVVVTPCFPQSGTARGVNAVDKATPDVVRIDESTMIAVRARGSGTPTRNPGEVNKGTVALGVVVLGFGLAGAIWAARRG